MTNEITIKNDAIAQIDNNGITGFENLQSEDIIIPRLRLLQDSSKSVKARKSNAGQFEDSLTGEAFDAPVEIVPLTFKNGAVMFEIGKEAPICRSNDGVNSINGDICAKCPFGEYHYKFKEDGSSPKCATTREFLIVKRSELLSETAFPSILTFSRGSLPAARVLLTIGSKMGPKLYRMSYMLDKTIKPYKKGSSFILNVSAGSKLTDDEYIVADRLAQKFAGIKIQNHDDTEFVTEV